MAYMAAVRLGSPETTEAELRRAVAAAQGADRPCGTFRRGERDPASRGMGMTDEMPISHYFKRLILIDRQFGDADHHLREMAGTSP